MREWEKNIRRVIPYVAGEQPNESDMVKLNTNECPYPPAPEVEAIVRELDSTKMRLYPDPEAMELVSEIAKYYQVDESMVFVGVGSDDVIANAFMTFFNSDKPILFPEITYSFYPVWADLYGVKYKTPALDEAFRLKAEDYYQENGGIIFPNPNAPTGLYAELDVVEDIVKNNQKSVVIVDEAYIDFGGISAMNLINTYENLLVVQTFSKSRSLAGMRIGFAIGHPDLISAMKAVKYSINSYTMNLAAIKAGAASVRNKEYFKETCKTIIDTRENTKRRLTELGFTYPDSMANFIFATHKDLNIPELFCYLRDKHIYVRHWDNPLIKDYLRITIGTDAEMNRFFEVVEAYMEENK